MDILFLWAEVLVRWLHVVAGIAWIGSSFYFIALDLGTEFFLPNIYSFGLVTSLIITVIFIAIYAYLFASSSRKISNALSVSKLQILNQKKMQEHVYKVKINFLSLT